MAPRMCFGDTIGSRSATSSGVSRWHSMPAAFWSATVRSASASWASVHRIERPPERSYWKSTPCSRARASYRKELS